MGGRWSHCHNNTNPHIFYVSGNNKVWEEYLSFEEQCFCHIFNVGKHPNAILPSHRMPFVQHYYMNQNLRFYLADFFFLPRIMNNITVLENEIHILTTKQLWQQKQDSAADLCALALTGTVFSSFRISK